MRSLSWQKTLLGVAVFLGTFALSLGIVSLILVKMPADYFSRSHERSFLDNRSPWLRVVGVVGKNVLGILLVLLGIVLSIPGVPGQGLLTILLGIMLLDIPGKRRLEQNLVSRPNVRHSINRLRKRFGKPALVLD